MAILKLLVFILLLHQVGMGQNTTTRGPHVLVFGSIYQVSIFGYAFLTNSQVRADATKARSTFAKHACTSLQDEDVCCEYATETSPKESMSAT